MAYSTNFARYLFFGFNFIFWILGIVVLAIGIYSRVQNDTWRNLIDTNTIFEAANLLVASGVIVAIIGFLGCCGAIKKYQWMLVVYMIIVVLIFILEIAAGAYAYTKRNMVEEKLANGLKKGIHVNYGKTDTASKGISRAIDWFQKKFKCCGASGPVDWQQSDWYTKIDRTAKVPTSCCRSPATNCSIVAVVTNSSSIVAVVTNSSSIVAVVTNSTLIFHKGCVEEGKRFVKENMGLIASVGIAIAIVELLGIVFAICLCMAFQREEKGQSVSTSS